MASQSTKVCPFCAETILAEARKCKHCGEMLDAAVQHESLAQAPAVPAMAHASLKQRTFGEVFGSLGLSVGLTVGLGYGFASYVLEYGMNPSEGQESVLLIMSPLVGIIAGCVVAFLFKGETVVREGDDPRKMLQVFEGRLAELGYKLIGQVDSLSTFKSDAFLAKSGGCVYVHCEGQTLRIVGPWYVVNKLRI